MQGAETNVLEYIEGCWCEQFYRRLRQSDENLIHPMQSLEPQRPPPYNMIGALMYPSILPALRLLLRYEDDMSLSYSR
jgi:hypothetical protein